jgi:hypothetical protein
VASGAACVLKFFHQQGTAVRERADTEKDNWKHIYEEEKWAFIKVHSVTKPPC